MSNLPSLLYADYPDREYETLSPPGRVKGETDAFTRFAPARDGRGRFRTAGREDVARNRALFAARATQPSPTR